MSNVTIYNSKNDVVVADYTINNRSDRLITKGEYTFLITKLNGSWIIGICMESKEIFSEDYLHLEGYEFERRIDAISKIEEYVKINVLPERYNDGGHEEGGEVDIQKLIKPKIKEKVVIERMPSFNITDTVSDIQINRCKNKHCDSNVELNELTKEYHKLQEVFRSRGLLGVDDRAIKAHYGVYAKDLHTIENIKYNPNLFYRVDEWNSDQDVNKTFVPDFDKKTSKNRRTQRLVNLDTGLESWTGKIIPELLIDRYGEDVYNADKSRMYNAAMDQLSALRTKLIDIKERIYHIGNEVVGYMVEKMDDDGDVVSCCPICGESQLAFEMTSYKKLVHDAVIKDTCGEHAGNKVEHYDGYGNYVIVDSEDHDIDPYQKKYDINGFTYIYTPEGYDVNRFQMNKNTGKSNTVSDSIYANVSMDDVLGLDEEGHTITNNDHIHKDNVVEALPINKDVLSKHLETLEYHKYTDAQLMYMRIGTRGARGYTKDGLWYVGTLDRLHGASKRNNDNWSAISNRKDTLHAEIRQSVANAIKYDNVLDI